MRFSYLDEPYLLYNNENVKFCIYRLYLQFQQLIYNG